MHPWKIPWRVARARRTAERGHPALCADRTAGDDTGMADLEYRSTRNGNGRVLGWLSGLGIVAVPWIASGIISTFLPEPEESFPWIFLGAFVGMVGWVAYGIARIPRFRRGALLGSAIALGFVGLLFALLWWSQS